MPDRLEDFHDAYKDADVDAIICLNGGWSANGLLSGIDWQLVKAQPKPLIGFSDITVLLNAIYAKTGNIGLLGPNLGSFGGRSCWKYTLQNLQDVLSGNKELTLHKSHGWKSDKSTFSTTRPWRILQKGKASGTLLGGNVGTFYLLHGTEFAPTFSGDIILAVEDDDEAGRFTAREFDRRLESILQQPGASSSIKGILIGRFQTASRVTMPDIVDIMKRKILPDVPIIADIDFGHTKPLLSLPIGGKIEIDANSTRPIIKLIEY